MFAAIAGAIGVFISKQTVMKYLGYQAKKIVAYVVGSISGSILAGCSCTILPKFAGISKMGPGLRPAIAFLYGPAINILAIIFTANILGIELGVARAAGAMLFIIIIREIMQFLFRKEEIEKTKKQMAMFYENTGRHIRKNMFYFAVMVLILVFANWAKPDEFSGIWYELYSLKWLITSVFAAGFFLGRPDGAGIILSEWISSAVGGNSIGINFFASISGAFMFFATLTEAPILQWLIRSGRGKGLAPALLWAGSPVSLPNMLVIKSVLG